MGTKYDSSTVPSITFVREVMRVVAATLFAALFATTAVANEVTDREAYHLCGNIKRCNNAVKDGYGEVIIACFKVIRMEGTHNDKELCDDGLRWIDAFVSWD